MPPRCHSLGSIGIPDKAKEENATGCTGPIERVTVPSLTFVHEDGGSRGVYGWRPYEEYREAAMSAGATPRNSAAPEPLEVLDRFGRCATAEIEMLTGRPRVVVEAELWSLAREWRLKPIPVLTGMLWEKA